MVLLKHFLFIYLFNATSSGNTNVNEKFPTIKLRRKVRKYAKSKRYFGHIIHKHTCVSFKQYIIYNYKKGRLAFMLFFTNSYISHNISFYWLSHFKNNVSILTKRTLSGNHMTILTCYSSFFFHFNENPFIVNNKSPIPPHHTSQKK